MHGGLGHVLLTRQVRLESFYQLLSWISTEWQRGSRLVKAQGTLLVWWCVCGGFKLDYQCLGDKIMVQEFSAPPGRWINKLAIASDEWVTRSRMCPTEVVNWLLCWLLRSLLIPSSLYSIGRVWRLVRLSAGWSSQATRSGSMFMLHLAPHYCARLSVNIWITCASEVYTAHHAKCTQEIH